MFLLYCLFPAVGRLGKNRPNDGPTTCFEVFNSLISCIRH